MARGGRLEPEQGQCFLGQEQVDVVVVGCRDERQVDNNACRSAGHARGGGAGSGVWEVSLNFGFRGLCDTPLHDWSCRRKEHILNIHNKCVGFYYEKVSHILTSAKIAL